MLKALVLTAFVAVMVAPMPAVAQQGSCNAYCTKRCTAEHNKGYCMSRCVPQCNAQNAGKKK
jgi:hypothetical protein